MTQTTFRFTGLAAVLTMVAGAACVPIAFAQDVARGEEPPSNPPHSAPAPSSPKPFEELDANADGAISKDEAAVDPPLAQAFGTLDTDADGRLMPEEYAVYAQGQS